MHFLKKLCKANAIAGNEGQVRDVLASELADISTNVCTDGIGGIVFSHVDDTHIKSTNMPRVMLAAHIDEVGFMVTNISDEGHLILKQIGGVKPLAQFMQKVVVTTQDKTEFEGIIQGSLDTDLYHAKNIKGASVSLTDIPGNVYVDLGLQNAKQVKDLGIAIGDMVTYSSDFGCLSQKNLVYGKAFDDRVGCYILSKVLQNIAKIQHANEFFAAGTSSEEVGTRGAKTVCDIVDPDIGIVIDACCHYDEFDRSFSNNKQIGHGPILIHSEKNCMPNKRMVKLVNDVADDLGIQIQHEMLKSGGTDAGKIHLHNGGVPTVTISIPLRYGHCAYSIADMDDVNAAIKLITEMVLRLDLDKTLEMYKFI